MDNMPAVTGAADVIRTIRGAEEEAARIVAAASRDAAELLKGVEETIQRDTRRSAKDDRAMIVKRLEDTDAEVGAEIAARGETHKERREALMREADARKGEAARFIFERVVEHGEG